MPRLEQVNYLQIYFHNCRKMQQRVRVSLKGIVCVLAVSTRMPNVMPNIGGASVPRRKVSLTLTT